jgi:general secretion pathway protein G
MQRLHRFPVRQPLFRSLGRQTRRGFTLLELLIVLAIIGVIAAMVGPRFFGTLDESKIKATQTSIRGLEQTLDLWRVNRPLPQGNQEALSVLMQTVDEQGREVEPLLDKIPRDAWGEPLYYEYPNTKAKTSRPAIWSAGPNRINDNGSGDDINNWSDLGR